MDPLAIPSLTLVDLTLPPGFERLAELAYNLWWTWQPAARQLFSGLDPELWARHRNPVGVLLELEPRTWRALETNEAFRAAFDTVLGAFDRDLGAPREASTGAEPGGVVAYVSTEFGLHESLPLYSGGLGILSGDHLKAASDIGLPLIGIGLLYRRGYFRQTLDADGRQQHFHPDIDPSILPIQRVLGRDGRPLAVSVPLLDREVRLAVHKLQVGRVPLLLLDSDLPENAPEDRPITHLLYVRGREMRLCQEWVLGFGAVRALAALGIEPAVWHLNEGHSAFVLFERLARELRAGEPLASAWRRVAANTVFTTHTPVPAGNETFADALARRYVAPWADRLGVPAEELLALGRAGSEEEAPFNMTALALRGASFRNAVSRKHQEVSSSMWRPLLGDAPDAIVSVTNGIHTESFLGSDLRSLFEERLGARWSSIADRGGAAWREALASIDDAALWRAHEAQKGRLIRIARENLRRMHARHGAAPPDLARIDRQLDPAVLTLGFARRFALYKRAGLLFRDVGRLRAIVGHPERPVQILFAGKAHPADREGQDLIAQLYRHAQSDEFRGRIVFLENYDLRIARALVQGVDVWLNTPRPPLEACGTSGQKAAANGVLNASVGDGWWLEAAAENAGWTIGPPPDANLDEAARDEQDAASLYSLLENEIAPLFYERDGEGLPRAWIARMRAALENLLPRFSARRMVREYSERAYAPLARADRRG
ncbi:MAG: alpha-glucan family phosphorylase [Acidobacteria bacterium]|nr:MAG: alpha-glucan family phosphorylase [Acidobacteriota bacterium]